MKIIDFFTIYYFPFFKLCIKTCLTNILNLELLFYYFVGF